MHAEVLAKRAFRRYLLEQVKKLKNNEKVDFIEKKTKYKLKSGTKVVFYTSALPCGDCQIYDNEDNDHPVPAKRRKLNGVTGCPPVGERVIDKMNMNNQKGLLRVKGNRLIHC